MRCPRCSGHRTIMGIGFMECSCPLCKGLGQIPASAQPTKESQELMTDAVDSKSVQKIKPKKAASK